MEDAQKLLYIAIAFIVGLGLGLTLTRAVTSTPVELEIVDVDDAIAAGLEQQVGAFRFSVVQKTNTASVEIFSVTDDIPTHYHPQENHILYITKGRATGKVNDVTAELAPGMLVFIPKGAPHSLDIKDAPFEFVLFSTPPFDPNDIVWVNETATKEEKPAEAPAEPTKPKELTVQLLELNGSGQSGTVTLTDIDGDTTVVLTLSGAPTGVDQPAHIHFGSCSNLGSVKYPLSLVRNSRSQTELTDSMDEILANLPFAINVHKSADEVNVYVACGDIVVP